MRVRMLPVPSLRGGFRLMALQRAVFYGLALLTAAAFWLAVTGSGAADAQSHADGSVAHAQGRDGIPVPARLIPAGQVISSADLMFVPVPARRPADTIMVLEDVVGLEARQDLAAGRPLLSRSVGPVRLVLRNTPVTLVFQAGSVRVEAEGVALSDAGEGDVVRAANAKTRQVVTGQVRSDGRIWVQR